MSSTTTTTLTAEQWRDQEEQVHLATAEDRNARLIAVRTALPDLEADADEAIIEHNTIVSRARDWNSPMPKPGERTKAAERAENLRERLAGAKALEARLSAQQMQTDVRVAQAVAEALGALYGVQAVGTVAPVKQSAPIDAPAIVVQPVELHHQTESRGVVGFEVILSAYTSLLSMAATGSVSLVS